MYYSKISKITFNNDKTIEIGPNDIVVFVGPNNCGKSQSLRDIYQLMTPVGKGIVIKDVEIQNGSIDELKSYLIENAAKDNPNNIRYRGYGYEIYSSQLTVQQNKIENNFRNFLVSFLKTEDRLKQADPPSSIEREDPKTHPIHYIAYNNNFATKVSDYFKQAFGADLTVNTLRRKSFPLCIGPTPALNSGGSMPDQMERLYDIISKYPIVNEQGDGIRSFTGIILTLILDNYGLFLIDEPESFLHPPQAKILGNVIADLLGTDRQTFISTHSEDILKGLLEKCPERIKVVRITRTDNTNKFSVLDNYEFESIWNDPLLKYSEIMRSLFHKSVVLCESESDCKFYSIILDHIKSKENRFSETLFVCCGGKQKLYKVVKALSSLSIDYRCITDIDIFHNNGDLQRLYESTGGEWSDDLKKNYNILMSGFRDEKVNLNKDVIRAKFKSALDSFQSEELSQEQLHKVQKALRVDSKWDLIKAGGENCIAAGDSRKAYDKLIEAANSRNIFIVPVGELECFVKTIGGHGPTWVDKVLETYKDIDSNE